VPADDGQRRLEIVDDAGEETPDGREALLALARLAGELQANGGGGVGGDELEELAVFLREGAPAALVVDGDGAHGRLLLPLEGDGDRRLRRRATDALVERPVAPRVVLGVAGDEHLVVP